MNLFTRSLSDYIKSEWDKVLKQSGPREARFIVQSLGPDSTLELFGELDRHRLQYLQNGPIKCYFRVATKLWQDWCKDVPVNVLDSKMRDVGALGNDGKREWIDEEDKLTWYRNRTVVDESTDALVIVLVGLNHATDQGGLADFHRVDEERVWLWLGQSFSPWLGTLLGGGSRPPDGVDDFDKVLRQLFELQPLMLGKLATYLKSLTNGTNNELSLQELRHRFFRELPFWGIPPLIPPDARAFTAKVSMPALREAEKFITHKNYNSGPRRKKDFQKVKEWLDADPAPTLPETVGDPPYRGADDLLETIRNFIFKADPVAQRRLLRTNLLPILEAISVRRPSAPREQKTVPLYTGTCFEVLLQGVWHGLQRYPMEFPDQTVAVDVQSISVIAECFNHDVVSDQTEGVGPEFLARELLQGCLGGLERIFEELDIRFPVDELQAELPSRDWERQVPVKLVLNIDELTIGTSRARPHVQFQVRLQGRAERELTFQFKWGLAATQPERVRFLAAKTVRQLWRRNIQLSRCLPAFRIPSVFMTAFYYAADEDEANRLVAQAMTQLEILDLTSMLPTTDLSQSLTVPLNDLIIAYWNWLERMVTEGYYVAASDCLPRVVEAFGALKNVVLDPSLPGSSELLKRLYKAFLIISDGAEPNESFLSAAIIWGISPPVLELVQAKTRFLAEGFSEAVQKLSLHPSARNMLDRLINLAQIHRPLAGIVVDSAQSLSAAIKSHGLLHYIGTPPSDSRSLAVQTLLRDDEALDDEEITTELSRYEETDVVARIIDDYQMLYPASEDGLRLLALNVRELEAVLSGLDLFLRNLEKRSSPDHPPFYLTLMVYSTSSSPMAMEARLISWKTKVLERLTETSRPLVLLVGHQYAPKEKIIELLTQEERIYDIGFLFHFLRGQLAGRTERASPFEFKFCGVQGLQFPIAEYPRPIQEGDRDRRQTVLSNRRLRIQNHHADLSARLRYTTDANDEHVIVGEVDYAPWAGIVSAAHRKVQWLACVDPFVDKRLLDSHEPGQNRKIVGFKSGLGAYGELNLTISTEQDTLQQLTNLVASRLKGLLPHANRDRFEEMAVRVVREAEEVIGLSSLRAVVGHDDRIREVVGFAAVRRAVWRPPDAAMHQLLPMDSLMHWFVDADVIHRPDLLQLTMEVRPGDIPLVRAVLIECKFAQQSSAHLAKAQQQVEEGLTHLTELLAPARSDLTRVFFDRRYWWAQLHRALTSRSVVSFQSTVGESLKDALDCVAEGQYEIQWQGLVFTVWTDQALRTPCVSSLSMSAETLSKPFLSSVGFCLGHFAAGYEWILDIFGSSDSDGQVQVPCPPICIRPKDQIDLGLRDLIKNTSIATPQDNAGVDNQGLQVKEPSPSPDTDSPSTPEAIDEAVTSKSTDNYNGDVAIHDQDQIPDESQPVSPEPSVVEVTVESVRPVPASILIGQNSHGDSVLWHYGHPQLANRHMLIFGSSGSGKTYGIQCLLAEMALQSLSSVVVDYTDGFLPAQMEDKFKSVVHPTSHYVATSGLPLDPFHRQRLIIDPSIPPVEESAYQVATRVQSTFTSAYEIGDQQSAALVRAVQSGLEEDPAFTLEGVLERLRSDGSKNAESLANKIEPLIRARPFRHSAESAWEGIFNDIQSRVQILQLKGLAREIQKLVTECVLWDLWDYLQNAGSKNRPVPVVLDEIQNLDHSSDSPIDKMLREGRKFGISLILATQTTSQFNQEQKDRLFQAGHKLFFKPATTEIDRFAQILAQSTSDVSRNEWTQRLSRLEKGQCWSLGPVLRSNNTLREEAILTRITSLEDRFEVRRAD